MRKYIYQSFFVDLPTAALAAALATRGSTMEAKKATVDMTGLPD